MMSVAALAAGAVIGLAALSALLTVIATHGSCTGTSARPSADAARAIPARYLTLYEQAGHASGVPWPVLAAIGSIESDHGRSHAPGVRSGVNRHGCCAGPMQFNIRDGPPSTWERYGVDGNHDDTEDVYDPEDAIPSAASYLRALLRAANGNLSQALFGYNHSRSYVSEVLARARAYARLDDQELAAGAKAELTTGCSDTGDLPAGPANLSAAQRVSSPRGFRTLPPWALTGGGPGAVDARLYGDVIWILRRYHLRVSAARAAGHNTHGDGTAVDLVPADGNAQAIWDRSAGALARDLGWSPGCARSGTRPACHLAPAIQFIGYDGYPRHGSPRTCAGDCPAHLHLSWASPCYGTSGLALPCEWVMAFTVLPADYPSTGRPGEPRRPPPQGGRAHHGVRAMDVRGA